MFFLKQLFERQRKYAGQNNEADEVAGNDVHPNNFPDPVRKLEDTYQCLTVDFLESSENTARENLQAKRHLKGNVSYMNIFLVGPMQAGKSSFLNSVVSAVKNDVVNLAAVSSSSVSVTQTLRKYSLEKTQIIFWDSPGELLHFKPEAFKAIFEGVYESGTQLEKISKEPSGNEPATNTGNYKINCIAVVLNILLFHSLQEEVVNHIQEVLNYARQNGLNDAIILTHLDKLVNTQDLSKSYTCSEVRQKIIKAGEVFGVPLNRIFVVSNYHEENKTLWQKNVLLLHALQKMAKICEDHISKLWSVQCPSIMLQKQNQSQKYVEEQRTEWAQLSFDHVTRADVILFGLPASGKSSLINSIFSLIHNCKLEPAVVSKHGIQHAKRFEYKLPIGRTPIYIHEMPNWRSDEEVADFVDNALDIFEEEKQNEGKRSVCAVIVIDQNIFADHSSEELIKIKEVASALRKRGLSDLCVLTKADKMLPSINYLTEVELLSSCKTKIKTASNALKVPEERIILLSNYIGDWRTEWQKDMSIAKLLREVFSMLQDYESNENEEELSQQERDQRTIPEIRNSIQQYMTPHGNKPLNILLIGPCASGKSSFITSILSMWNSEILTYARAFEHSMDESETVKLQRYQVQGDAPVYLWDTPGIMKTMANFKFILQAIIEGRLKKNTNLSQYSEQHIPTKSVITENRIDCTAFVFNINFLDRLLDMKRELLDLHEYICYTGMTSVVILTNIDKYGIRDDNLPRAFQKTIIKRKMKFLSDMLGISDDQIFPVCNYVNERMNNEHKDFLLALGLEALIKNAHNYQLFHLKNKNFLCSLLDRIEGSDLFYFGLMFIMLLIALLLYL